MMNKNESTGLKVFEEFKAGVTDIMKVSVNDSERELLINSYFQYFKESKEYVSLSEKEKDTFKMLEKRDFILVNELNIYLNRSIKISQKITKKCNRIIENKKIIEMYEQEVEDCLINPHEDKTEYFSKTMFRCNELYEENELEMSRIELLKEESNDMEMEIERLKKLLGI